MAGPIIPASVPVKSYLRVEEFAARYGITRRTVYYWIEWHWLPTELVCGARRIPLKMVEIIEHRRHPAETLVQFLKRSRRIPLDKLDHPRASSQHVHAQPEGSRRP